MTDLVPAESDSTYLPRTNWTYVDVAFVFGAGLLAAIAATIVAVVIELQISGDQEPSISLQFGLIVPAQSLGMLAVLWLMLQRRKIGSWAAGYGLVLRLRDWWAVLAGVGLQIAAALALTGLAALLSFEPPEQSIATLVTGLDSPFVIFIAGIAVVVLAPLSEEIVFRGMLLSRMLRSYTSHVAVVLSGFVFSAVHVLLDPSAWYNAIGLFAIGIALGYLALSTKELSRAIWAHAGINGLGFVALVASDQLAETEGVIGVFGSLIG